MISRFCLQAGWGKKLTYCLAVGRTGAVDVTRRYSKDFAVTLQRRTQVDERWLADYLDIISKRLCSTFSSEEGQQFTLRRDKELAQLLGMEPVASEGVLPGRQSGSAAWVSSRGEMGTSLPKKPVGRPEPPTLHYSLIRDDHLLKTMPNRVCGGVARASDENAPEETAVKVRFTIWDGFGLRTANSLQCHCMP
jgi:hypothetical protein